MVLIFMSMIWILLTFLSTYNYWNSRMVDNVGTYTSHNSPTDRPMTSSPANYHSSIFVLRDMNYDLSGFTTSSDNFTFDLGIKIVD